MCDRFYFVLIVFGAYVNFNKCKNAFFGAMNGHVNLTPDLLTPDT